MTPHPILPNTPAKAEAGIITQRNKGTKQKERKEQHKGKTQRRNTQRGVVYRYIMIKSKKKKPLKQKISSKGSHALSIASTVPSATFMEHVIKTYLAPFPCSPPRPIPLSVQRQELHQHMYVIDKVSAIDNNQPLCVRALEIIFILLIKFVILHLFLIAW